MKNKINPRFCIIPTQRFSSLTNSVNGTLDRKIGNFFFLRGGGGGPLRQRQGGCHSTSTSLALKVIRIVYNPPFEKFLDPPLGPSWLSDDETKWPSWDFQQIDDNTLVQMAKQAGSPPQIMCETPALIEMENKQEHSVKPVAPFELNEKNYSCLTRLLRVTAWALRFILKVKKKSTGKEELKAEEIEHAKLMWERHVQNSSFSSEINAVKKNTKNNLKDQLGLQLDQNGILRCHGRMIRENLPESSILPKLPPKNHAFTSLLINSFHEKLMHAGVSHTLSAIRREFWIPQGRTTVRNVLLNCRRCRRHQGGPYKMPKMAPYPPSRIEESSPFTYTALTIRDPCMSKRME